MEGGGQIFCSNDIVEKATSKSDYSKTKAEDEKLKYMCLLIHWYSGLYPGLMKDIKESKYLGLE